VAGRMGCGQSTDYHPTSHLPQPPSPHSPTPSDTNKHGQETPTTVVGGGAPARIDSSAGPGDFPNKEQHVGEDRSVIEKTTEEATFYPPLPAPTSETACSPELCENQNRPLGDAEPTTTTTLVCVNSQGANTIPTEIESADSFDITSSNQHDGPDDATPVAVSIRPETAMGFLLKQGHIIKNWKSRFVVLEKGSLKYYVTSSSLPSYGKDLKGGFDLAGYTVSYNSSLQLVLRHCMDDIDLITDPNVVKELVLDCKGGNRSAILATWYACILQHIAFADVCIPEDRESHYHERPSVQMIGAEHHPTTEENNDYGSEAVNSTGSGSDEKNVEACCGGHDRDAYDTNDETVTNNAGPSIHDASGAAVPIESIPLTSECPSEEFMSKITVEPLYGHVGHPVDDHETVCMSDPFTDNNKEIKAGKKLGTLSEIQPDVPALKTESEPENKSVGVEEADRESEIVAPNIIMGFLLKKGHLVKNWKSRYFVVDKGRLKYYVSKSKDPREGETLKGGIDLQGYSAKLVEDHKILLSHDSAATSSFFSSSEKELLLDCPPGVDRYEMLDIWLQTLQQHIRFANQVPVQMRISAQVTFVLK
jgi:hypothetical protein